jgi:hypothetical protein
MDLKSNYLERLSNFISIKSAEEAEFHPIDRFFLEPYVADILKMPHKEFLFYNLETRSKLHNIYLMLCLPEVWEKVTVDDIIDMINRFKNISSLYALMEFTYKYIEIDIIPLIFASENVKTNFQDNIILHIRNLYMNFFKDEGDFFFFDKGIIGVSLTQWNYVKQIFLLDERIKPAVKSVKDFFPPV